MKKILVKLDCHPYYPSVWFTNSRILYRIQCAKFRPDVVDLSGYGGSVSQDETGSNMVIGLFTNDDSFLAHELCHVVINIFSAVNMDVNGHTTEAFAYLYESLYRQCMSYLSEWRV